MNAQRKAEFMKMTDENTPHIIVTGDPLDGFKFYGPFKNWDEACEMAEADDYLSEAVWWCAALETLTKGEDSISPSGDIDPFLVEEPSISPSSAKSR